MSTRRKARETALQILYKMDIYPGGPAEEALQELEALAHGTEARGYCEALVRGIGSKRSELDAAIEAHAENWTVERMAVVDRNILRIAVYELLYSKGVPYRAVIDEAVELAKRYGTDESGAFINGVVDRVRKELPAAEDGRD